MNKDVHSGSGRPKRKRRTPEEARREILDAAGQRLRDQGPDGLRLQLIAADLGISHSSILHHFGSREGMLEALARDAYSALERDLRAQLSATVEGDPAVHFFENVSTTLGEKGYARLLAWQIISDRRDDAEDSGEQGMRPDGSGGLLAGLALALHAQRKAYAMRKALPEPDLDDSRSIVAATACMLLGEALAGHIMVRSAGLDDGPEARKAFRAWLAKFASTVAFPRPTASTPAGTAASQGARNADEAADDPQTSD